MLAIATSKHFAERVEWVQHSAQAYTSSRRFDLIFMTGHAFQVLLTDDDALEVLATMRNHVDEPGRVVFESRNPNLDWAKEWAGRVRKLPGEIFETLEITTADGEFISFETTYQFPDKKLTTASTLRFPSLEHVETLINRSRLKLNQVLGDWDSSPLTTDYSREMIFHVQRSK